MAAFPVPSFGRYHRFRRYWRKPWTRRARRSKKFKLFCWKHGFVSPHFTRDEWASKDGKVVPWRLRGNAQRHAFNLERMRHQLGDKPLGGLSYYRSPEHNTAVGGASQSRHVQADACDFSVETVNKFGRTRFLAVVEKVFSDGGVGNYPGGNVHVDSRGYRARWSSW